MEEADMTWVQTVENYYQTLWVTDKFAWTIMVIFGMLLLSSVLSWFYFIAKKLRGYGDMRKKTKLKREVMSIVSASLGPMLEDKIVCGISQLEAEGKLTRDDARIVYAHYAYNIGMWGLLPQRYNPPPSKLDMQLLKEELAAKHWANGNPHTTKVIVGTIRVPKILSGISLRRSV
jgi:hypothetical protein